MRKRQRLNGDLKQRLEEVVGPIDDVVLYINSGCNLRCKHCYIGDALLNANVAFETADVVAFINGFSALERITILGGEPFLHKGINDVVRSALSIEIADRRITTNLTDFFFFDVAQFAQAPLTLAVSLDGATADVHDGLRGVGAFERTIKNVRTLVAARYEVEVSHTITARNIDSFWSLVELCRQMGVRKLNLHKMSLQGNAITHSDLYVTPERWVRFCSEIDAHSGAGTSETVRVRFPPMHVTAEQFERLVASGEYWSHKEGSYHSRNRGSRVVLYPNGRVYVSSELFGTESHIGQVDGGVFTPNEQATSELSPAHRADDPAMMPKLTRAITVDDHFSALLSVSYKRIAHL